MTEPQHAELLAAKRIFAGCAKILAFPEEELTPNVKSILDDQYTVAQAFINQCEHIERLEAALRTSMRLRNIVDEVIDCHIEALRTDHSRITNHHRVPTTRRMCFFCGSWGGANVKPNSIVIGQEYVYLDQFVKVIEINSTGECVIETRFSQQTTCDLDELKEKPNAK